MSSLKEIKTLEELNSSVNNGNPNEFQNVEILCINYIEELQYFPDGLFGKLSELKEFVSFDNKIKELPNDISKMKNLTKLNVHDNCITVIPDSIGELNLLEKLFLYNNADEGNEIKEIPKSIGFCKNLSVINISGNLLTSLPDELFSGCNLSLLNVADNKITSLPSSIASAKNLEKLNLGENKVCLEF